MTLSIIASRITTFIIMTLNIMTLSITIENATLSISDSQHLATL